MHMFLLTSDSICLLKPKVQKSSLVRHITPSFTMTSSASRPVSRIYLSCKGQKNSCKCFRFSLNMPGPPDRPGKMDFIFGTKYRCYNTGYFGQFVLTLIAKYINSELITTLPICLVENYEVSSKVELNCHLHLLDTYAHALPP